MIRYFIILVNRQIHLMSKSSSKKIKTLFHILLAIIIIAPIVGITSYIFYAKDLVNEELKELTSQRKVAFSQIRPAFMKYKNEHGVFPDALQQLVPEYVSSIPDVLQSPEDEYPIVAIKYIVEGSSAFFHYHTGYGEVTTMSYDIGSNAFSDDKQRVNTE